MDREYLRRIRDEGEFNNGIYRLPRNRMSNVYFKFEKFEIRII